MKPPTDLEREQLAHIYDPVKAREYYLKNRELKGRKKGQSYDTMGERVRGNSNDPRRGKTKVEISKGARAKQRKELAMAIKNLEQKLQKLEALIKKKMHGEKTEDRKGKAKKERAAKEADKPDTAAEKAKNARENKKYRDKNQQKIKADTKKDNSKSAGGSSSKDSKETSSSESSISSLKSLATKVRGQIVVAKQKLAAL